MKIKHILMIIISIFLCGCTNFKMETAEKISAPDNNYFPIKASWIVENHRYILNDSVVDENKSSWINKKIEFYENSIVIDGEVSNNLSYKIKSVDSKNYFINTYKIDPKVLGIGQRYVKIIDLNTKGKNLIQFVKVDENNLIMFVDYVFYNLKKIHNDTKLSVSKKNNGNIKVKTGVLIGFRNENNDYSTLWINNEAKENYKKELPYLLVPRRNGFWRIGITNEENKYGIYTYQMKKPDYIIKEESSQYNSIKKIKFVSSEYIGVEYLDKEKFKLKVLPIDGIKESIGIKLSDVGGNKLKQDYIHSFKDFLSSLNKEDANHIDKDIKEDNFILNRYAGQWILTGRAYNLQGKAMDFQLDNFPSKKFVNYNKFPINWFEIENKNNKAIDGLIAPSENIAIIIEEEKISVFEMSNDGLKNKPKIVFNKNKNEQIIMIEWATHSYVDKWDKIVNEQIKKNTEL